MKISSFKICICILVSLLCSCAKVPYHEPLSLQPPVTEKEPVVTDPLGDLLQELEQQMIEPEPTTDLETSPIEPEEPVLLQEHTPGKLYVEILIEDSILNLYRGDPKEELVFLESFYVATPRVGLSEYPLGLGYITDIQFRPNWMPTKSTVDYLNKKLIRQGKKPSYHYGEIIKPGDPRHAMGDFKMTLTHSTENAGPVYRIHGTRDYESIGHRKSSGCTRMDDRDPRVIAFAKIIADGLKLIGRIPVNIKMK